MCAGSGPPGGARIIHQGADELLVKQNSVPDGKITPPGAGPGRWPHFIPNSAALLALPLDSLRSWLNEQAWLA